MNEEGTDMNKVPLVAAATLAALAAPSVAIAEAAPQAGTIQQAGITVESTDEFASNYTPSAGEYVLGSYRFTAESTHYRHMFGIPEGYPLHRVSFYVEHENGNTEVLRRTIADTREPSNMPIDFRVDGSAVVTAVLDLWDKTIVNYEFGGSGPSYDPHVLQEAYDTFASRYTAVLDSISTENAAIDVVAEDKTCIAQIDDSTPFIEEVPNLPGTDLPSYYAEGTATPKEGSSIIGTYRYGFKKLKPSLYDDFDSPISGFRFSVDKAYAGQTAIVYIDTGRAPGNISNDSAGIATHRVKISDDGTFTVPHGVPQPAHNENYELVGPMTNLWSADYRDGYKVQGLITVLIENPRTLANGVQIDYRTCPNSHMLETGAVATVENSDLDLSLGSFYSGEPMTEYGYERPKEGGLFAGSIILDVTPYGNEGDSGYFNSKVNFGKKYAGRTATVYTSYETSKGFSDIRSFTIDDNGEIYIPEYAKVSHENDYYLSSLFIIYYINIEPVDTVSIDKAAVSKIPNQIWSDTPVTPKPTVTLDGKVLAEGTDYELSYEDNDRPGTAAVIITGKGAYTGTVRVEFQIVEKGDEPSGPSDPSGPDTPGTSDDPEKPAPTFPDVTEDAWYFEAVTRAAELGVMNGYSGSDCFGPLDWLTREQAAAVMFNYLGDNNLAAPPAPQKDVLNDWYTDAVNWAVAEGVMGGYAGADLFGIGQTLTREEFCAVIANAAGADLEAADTSVLDRFADGSAVSAWARPAVAWAVEAGIMNGVELGDGSRALQATRGLVRAEMAAMTVSAIDAGVLD